MTGRAARTIPVFRMEDGLQKEHYQIFPACDFKDLKKLNDQADTFLMGSGSGVEFCHLPPLPGAFYLNFVRDEKKKIAYGASFGHPGFLRQKREIEKARKYLSGLTLFP